MDSKSKMVFAILVTYNRRHCLSVALTAIEKQTIPIEGILIVDNKSTDDTQEFLKNRGFILGFSEGTLQETIGKSGIKQIYYRNSENVGGAGGFAKAIELVQNYDADYIWIMDDDVEPEPNCLENMLSFMSDEVKACIPNRTDEFNQDRPCIDLNMGNITKIRLINRKKFVSHPLDKDFYYVRDMPFEGPLVDFDVIKRVGLPEAGFFIEYDDTDYAQRILKYTKIGFVTNACLHRQLSKTTNSKKSVRTWKYIWRDYYSIRNNILFNHRYGKNVVVKHFNTYMIWLWHVFRSIKHRQIQNIFIINKAVRDGIKDKYGKIINPGEF